MKKLHFVIIVLAIILTVFIIGRGTNKTVQVVPSVSPTSTTTPYVSSPADTTDIDSSIKQTENSLDNLPDSFNPSELDDSALGQ